MATEYISKVVYGNQTLIDLTNDTVDSAHLLQGYTAHGADGAIVSGSCTFDADTSDATANASEILATKTAYKNGQKLVGSMTNVGQQTATISAIDGSVSITAGYHDGSGTVTIDAAEQSKLIANNIRKDITILGVTGTMSGSENVKASAVVATPYTTTQTILPTDLGDYNYISSVTINAIAYSTAPNTGNGLTATIGTVKP